MADSDGASDTDKDAGLDSPSRTVSDQHRDEEEPVTGDQTSSTHTPQQPNRHQPVSSGIHQLKWVPWDDDFVPIVTQNENGPCPLLALCNVLMLTKRLQITPGETVVTAQQLLDMLGSSLIDSVPKNDLDEGERSNYEQNMTDAVSVFPRLLTGLDVNVKFDSVTGFEFTPELSIFDLLGVGLYHGWLADPGDTESYSVAIQYSYNQLVAMVIENSTSQDPEKVRKALCGQQFLESTASQLTYHGLCELNSRVREGDMCVFFRNNHFNTMLKRKGQLLLLVTDLGFLNEFGHVWHVLGDIDDSGEFLNAAFQPSSFVSDTAQVPEANTTPLAPSEGNTEEQQQHQSRLDYEIAAGLMAEEQEHSTPTLSVPDKTPPATLSDHEIALALHQEEVEQATAAARVGEGSSTAQRPSTRSTASPVGSPPSTREEYEQAAYQDRQQSSPNCNIL